MSKRVTLADAKRWVTEHGRELAAQMAQAVREMRKELQTVKVKQPNIVLLHPGMRFDRLLKTKNGTWLIFQPNGDPVSRKVSPHKRSRRSK